MPNVIDTDNLSKIFGVENQLQDDPITVLASTSPITPTIDISEDDEFDIQLKELMKNANDILSAARYLINTTPDAESIASAASLISSINGIVSEFRKTSQMKKRFEYQKKLELLKIEARERMQNKRIEAEKDKVKIGDGNTINIQNNNMLPFSQEKIINIIEERKKTLQLS